LLKNNKTFPQLKNDGTRKQESDKIKKLPTGQAGKKTNTNAFIKSLAAVNK